MAATPTLYDLSELVAQGIHPSTESLSLARSSTSSRSVEGSGPPTPVHGPPQNYDLVEDGIYRSSFPRPCNFDYLNTLGLRTVITLVPGPYPREYTTFLDENGVTHYEIPFPAHKDDADCIPLEAMEKTLRLLRDRTNHPLLIHCNKGKHRTGCAVACYRISSGCDLSEALAEYRRYAGVKARVLDERYIESFARKWEHSHGGALIDSVRKRMYPTPPASDKD